MTLMWPLFGFPAFAYRIWFSWVIWIMMQYEPARTVCVFLFSLMGAALSTAVHDLFISLLWYNRRWRSSRAK